MIRGFYTARSGLYAHQQNMDVIANNLANVNTVGFKPSKVSFKDLIYQNINRYQIAERFQDQYGEANAAMVGHGVKINKTDLNMTMGALQPTYSKTDFVILEEGQFFAAQDPITGEISYTRAGNFILSNQGEPDGGTYYLAAGNGDLILNADSEPIEIEFEQVEERTPILDEEGNAVVDDNGNATFNTRMVQGDPIITTDLLGVFRFDNPYGLTQAGNNRYIPSETSGEPIALEAPSLMAGYLEGSGTEIATEMVRVIEAQKSFSLNSKMIQAADEVEEIVNTLRR